MRLLPVVNGVQSDERGRRSRKDNVAGDPQKQRQSVSRFVLDRPHFPLPTQLRTKGKRKLEMNRPRSHVVVERTLEKPQVVACLPLRHHQNRRSRMLTRLGTARMCRSRLLRMRSCCLMPLRHRARWAFRLSMISMKQNRVPLLKGMPTLRQGGSACRAEIL